MELEELTPIFPPHIKPVRKGIYLATVDPGETYYRYWNGRYWLTGGSTIALATKEIPKEVINDSPMFWRGLAKEPK